MFGKKEREAFKKFVEALAHLCFKKRQSRLFTRQGVFDSDVR